MAPYSANFTNPDPYAWLASSGEFSAQDVFGPPATVLSATDAGYPGTTMQAAAVQGRGAGGNQPWYRDRGVHGLFWLVGGAVLFHLYLRAE